MPVVVEARIEIEQEHLADAVNVAV